MAPVLPAGKPVLVVCGCNEGARLDPVEGKDTAGLVADWVAAHDALRDHADHPKAYGMVAGTVTTQPQPAKVAWA